MDLGSTGTFDIVLRSHLVATEQELKELLSDAKYTFSVRLVGPTVALDALLEDNEDGSRTATFFPTKAAVYRANVKMNDSPIHGSPFELSSCFKLIPYPLSFPFSAVAARLAKKRKVDAQPSESAPKRRKQEVESIQYDDSSEPLVETILISPPSKAASTSGRAKLHSDLEAATLILDPSSGKSVAREPSKVRMVVDDDADDAADTLPMSANPVDVSAKPAARETGILRYESDEEGYNTGDSNGGGQRSANKPGPGGLPPAVVKKRTFILASDDEEEEVQWVPRDSSTEPKPATASRVDDDEIEPTLLI